MSSNQRPDTLMQDRICWIDEPLAPHGRTIHWVNRYPSLAARPDAKSAMARKLT
jgi:hypothetical protein